MSQIDLLEKIQSNHQQLLQLLERIQQEEKTDLYVPIIDGLMFSKAVTHSKRVTVSLGDNWFVEVNIEDAIPLLQRRLNGRS
jgi:prefoldin subunit 5